MMECKCIGNEEKKRVIHAIIVETVDHHNRIAELEKKETFHGLPKEGFIQYYKREIENLRNIRKEIEEIPDCID